MKLENSVASDIGERAGNRRRFLRKVSLLTIGAIGGHKILTGLDLRKGSAVAGVIRLVDRNLAFVGDPVDSGSREIPKDFLFSQYPAAPAVPKTARVDFPWKEENFTNGSLGAIDQLGAINEGIYTEGKRILQIVASTPGTPDTGSGSPQYKNWYRISTDGGSSFSEFRLMIAEGGTRENPLPGVTLGRNGYTTPFTSPVIRSAKGEILVPVNLHPWDEQQQRIYNPADAFLFGDAGVLIGKWNAAATDIVWSFGNWLRIDHNRSTRGLFEPSLAEIEAKGCFVMVARGSNLKRTELPSYAWVSFSSDQCRTWSSPEPFGYSDGTPFYVPASCSTLFRSRHTGILYWVGNLTNVNPEGNHPRNPLVIGQVDEQMFGLIKGSIFEIDRCHPDKEEKNVELSNFKILEHSHKNEIVVVLTRRVKSQWAGTPSWYRLSLT